MSALDFEDLKRHVGHKIVCVHYHNPPWNIDDSTPLCENVAIECETCNEVLMDFDNKKEGRIKNFLVDAVFL